jgi:hypothetical protein
MSHIKDTWFLPTPSPLRAHAIFLSVPILFAIGLLLLVRRAAGAFDSPLSPTLQLITATLLAAWLSVVNDHWLEQPSKSDSRGVLWDQIAVATAWATLALFAIACSFPYSRLIDWIIWPTAFAAAWFGPQAFARLRLQVPLLFPPRLGSHRAVTPNDENDDLPIQTLTRTRSHDGIETIHAQLRAEFAPGERDATLHVAFCPPFTRLPTVEAYLTDDIPADVKLTQVLHHGAQIDIRLPTPAHARTTASVELIASNTADTPANP